MDIRLSDEQRMLIDIATRLGTDLAPSGVAGLAAATRSAGDAAGWSSLVETGLIALHVPAERGGGGGRTVDVALVAEQLAAALVPVPYVGAAVWAPTLLAAAGAADAVEAVAAGSLRLAPVLRPDLGGLARLGEPGIAFDTQGADAGLLLDADGTPHAIAMAASDSASHEGGSGRGGVAVVSADLTRSVRVVPADAPVADLPVRLGGPLDGDARTRADAVVLAILAADLLGVMGRALDDAVAYVGQREQFGVPVGSFQAVQHLAAHAATLVEGARSSMWHAAWAADELPADAALLAARQAKAFCAAAARDVGETAIQLLGGIGLTWEHLAHVRQRRILLARRVLGDEQAQYAAIAAARLTPRSAAAPHASAAPHGAGQARGETHPAPVGSI